MEQKRSKGGAGRPGRGDTKRVELKLLASVLEAVDAYAAMHTQGNRTAAVEELLWKGLGARDDTIT